MISIIHILGASGSGTTALAKAISDKWGYNHLDTDDFFWLPTNPPFTQKRERTERQNLLKEALKASEKSVISGSMCGWGDIFIPHIDLTVYLLVPQDMRINRLQQREYKRFEKRILKGGDMYKNHSEFIEWAKTYDTAGTDQRSKAQHEEWLKQLKCPIIRIENIYSLDYPLEQIEKITKDMAV